MEWAGPPEPLSTEGVKCVDSPAVFQLSQLKFCHWKGIIVHTHTSTSKVLQFLPWADRAMKSQLGRKKKIIPVALHAVIYFIFLSKPHIHTFPLPTARQIFAYQFCCKLQIEFSRCLCRPHLSDDFIAFMEPFVTQLLLSCFVLGFFFETQTWYRCFKLGTRKGKPVGCLAFCFSLSPRRSEVLWQVLAAGPGLVWAGAQLRVPFCHHVSSLSLINTGTVPFSFAPFSLPEGKKVIIHFLFALPHTCVDNILLPSAEGLGFWCHWQIWCVLTHCQVLKLPVHKVFV